ncbi:MAG: hypothetical protein WAR24_05725 [Candidatus Acidiferrales bacterium]
MRPRWRWFVAAGVSLFLFAAGLFLHARIHRIDDYTRSWIVRALSQRFHSEVELSSLRVEIFPRMGVTGEGLSLYYNGRKDLPPLIQIENFTFDLGILGIVRVPHEIQFIRVENMTITMPPAGEGRPHFPMKSDPDSNTSKRSAPQVLLREIEVTDTALVLLPKQAGKEPLEWNLHNLVLRDVGGGRAFPFYGTLTNGKPKGEITTKGQIGPWKTEDPGSTPVSGTYEFTDADLGPFAGIAGILSSTGKYSGPLNKLEVDGETDTPDFSLDRVGRPVPLHTDYSATVDGTSGDTYLHPVHAVLGRSLIVAEGSVVKVPEMKGHLITLDVSTPESHIEDILNLAANSNKPLLTGPTSIKAKLVLPPGKQKVLDKMTLDGAFGVTDARWSNSQIQEKLKSLSRHAQGEPENEDVGSAISKLRGRFRLKNAVITISRLTFSVLGASIGLAGTYKIHSEEIDLQGQLHMEAKLSQTVTGRKSFFLKSLDPFFKKNGAGTVLPLSISGTRKNPTIGVTVFHKTIKTKMGDDKNSPPK